MSDYNLIDDVINDEFDYTDESTLSELRDIHMMLDLIEEIDYSNVNGIWTK